MGSTGIHLHKMQKFSHKQLSRSLADVGVVCVRVCFLFSLFHSSVTHEWVWWIERRWGTRCRKYTHREQLHELKAPGKGNRSPSHRWWPSPAGCAGRWDMGESASAPGGIWWWWWWHARAAFCCTFLSARCDANERKHDRRICTSLPAVAQNAAYVEQDVQGWFRLGFYHLFCGSETRNWRIGDVVFLFSTLICGFWSLFALFLNCSRWNSLCL